MRADLRERLRRLGRSAPVEKSGVARVACVAEAATLPHHTPPHAPPHVGPAGKSEQNQRATPATRCHTAESAGEDKRHTFGHAEPGEAPVWPCVAGGAEDWTAAFDERAGFLEHDCGLTRAEAERVAHADLLAAAGLRRATRH